MGTSGEVLRSFYQAVVRRDFATARRYLKDDLVFVGLFETCPSADAYLAALTGLMQIVIRLDIKVVIAEGKNVAVFFELETRAPAEATTLVAEWHQVEDGKIFHVASASTAARSPPCSPARRSKGAESGFWTVPSKAHSCQSSLAAARGWRGSAEPPGSQFLGNDSAGLGRAS
jgi:hypothetical protein